MATSKRMEALVKTHRTGRIPKLRDDYAGWYRAPNGQRYFGLGSVLEFGTTHDGSVYVEVEPKSRRKPFFDPFTDEDMPRDQYPPPKGRPRRGPPRHDRKQSKSTSQIGEMDWGVYVAASGLRYMGLGRVVTPHLNEKGEFSFWLIEPVRGGPRLWEGKNDLDQPVQERPRSPYSGSLETQQKENPNRPRRKLSLLPWEWFGGLPFMPKVGNRNPRLGDEHPGAYFAPDGQWFAGVGKVVRVGFINDNVNAPFIWVHVEPVEGKRGGDYDFFHPATCEWMDELPTNPIPGTECTAAQRRTLPNRWRDFPAITKRPKVGDEYPGRYFPPNAPKRDVFIGKGKVVKSGVNKQGRIWVDVKPIAGKNGGHYEFFDPWTGLAMPDEYYPDEE